MISGLKWNPIHLPCTDSFWQLMLLVAALWFCCLWIFILLSNIKTFLFVHFNGQQERLKLFVVLPVAVFCSLCPVSSCLAYFSTWSPVGAKIFNVFGIWTAFLGYPTSLYFLKLRYHSRRPFREEAALSMLHPGNKYGDQDSFSN